MARNWTATILVALVVYSATVTTGQVPRRMGGPDEPPILKALAASSDLVAEGVVVSTSMARYMEVRLNEVYKGQLSKGAAVVVELSDPGNLTVTANKRFLMFLVATPAVAAGHPRYRVLNISSGIDTRTEGLLGLSNDRVSPTKYAPGELMKYQGQAPEAVIKELKSYLAPPAK